MRVVVGSMSGVLLGLLAACSSSDDASSAPNGSAGTSDTAGVGGKFSNGGASNAGNSNGGSANGGASNGGASNAGSSNSAGSQAVGGSVATGGGAGSSAAGNSNGGASGAAGAGKAGSGGSAGSSTGVAACPGASATEFNLVSGWLSDTQTKGALPAYAYSNIQTNFPVGSAFDQLACSIAMSCVEFAPMEANWLRECEAVLTSAIVAESSYNPKEVVNDSYSMRTVGNVSANDPTIGLLQIRFSSTVHDYNYFGAVPKMAAIGCTWPAELSSQPDTDTWWATNGGTSYIPFMQQVPCNIGLAAWYYFYNATGNGGQNALYISDYCAGHGVAGTMVDGLLSHLMGGAYPRPADANNAYPWGIECCAGGSPSDTTCTGCSGRFAAFMGIGTSNARPTPDPFQEQLMPEVSKYCR
jgi:hypothetical protein